jgi:hypothetical protein
MAVHFDSKHGRCPKCNLGPSRVYDFSNSDEYLKREVPRVLEERRNLGLDGLVGGLDSVIINTEPEQQQAAVEEFLRYTGLEFANAFQDLHHKTCVLQKQGSANFLVRSRRDVNNPFVQFNKFPKSQHLPNTRLETFVFKTTDIEKYASIQKSRGVAFITDEIIKAQDFSFI